MKLQPVLVRKALYICVYFAGLENDWGSRDY